MEFESWLLTNSSAGFSDLMLKKVPGYMQIHVTIQSLNRWRDELLILSLA